MSARQVDQKCSQWKQIEQRNYFYFLILEADLLEEPNKKQTRFFQKMGRFIDGRTNQQCRTHHSRKTEKFKRRHQERLFVYKLYHQYCKMRLIGEQHLKREIAYFINKSLSQGRMTASQASYYLAKLDQNIQKLKLEDTCRVYEEKNSRKHNPVAQQRQVQIAVETIDQDIFFCPEEKSTSVHSAISSFGSGKQVEIEDIDSYLNQYESSI